MQTIQPQWEDGDDDAPWSRIRNVFSVHEAEGACHKEHLSRFDNGVPNFGTAQEAEQYIRDFGGVPSHPRDASLTHGLTLFTSMDELQEFVFPKIYQLLETQTQSASLSSSSGQRVPTGGGLEPLEDACRVGLWDAVETRLATSIHAEMPVFEAVRNSFQYLYHHMKFGIFVMIQDSEIKVFAPFVNHKEYRNTWWPWCDLRSEQDVHRYYQQKAHYLGMPVSKLGQYNPNTSEWWVNGNILCNWTNEDIWGDHFLFALKHMIAETCRHHPVPNALFFVNKRDYPQIKFNCQRQVMVEPYGFMWDRNDKKPEADVDLPESRQFPSLLPVLSFYTSNRFVDLGMPCTEDWEAATGRVFPCTMLRSRIVKQDIRCRDLFALGQTHPATTVPWHHKRHTAFFRGTATGSGVSTETNPRIRLAQLDYEWNHGVGGASLSRLNHSSSRHPSPLLPPSSHPCAGYLDAKLTGWNLRDKKRPGHRLSFVKKHQYSFRVNGVQNFVPLAAQAQYKYLIYIDGHCAACRFGYMMSLGSVILRVESDCVADQMWYFHLLEPYRHFVPVKSDLSDLREKIEWCRKHDVHCRAIAENARLFHRQYLSKEGIMSYLCGVLTRIHQHTVWPTPPVERLAQISYPSPAVCDLSSTARRQDVSSPEEDVSDPPTTTESAASGVWSDMTEIDDDCANEAPVWMAPSQHPTTLSSHELTGVAAAATPFATPLPGTGKPSESRKRKWKVAKSSTPPNTILSSPSLPPFAVLSPPPSTTTDHVDVTSTCTTDAVVSDSVQKAMDNLPCLSFDVPEPSFHTSMPFSHVDRKKIVVRVKARLPSGM